MAYTALEKMRIYNRETYGKDVGPAQPYLFDGALERNDLKSAALRFLHERCEELKFDDAIEKEENEKKEFHGRSLKQDQIPYNMEMDLNRLCLEKSLERFFNSGIAEDAYDVYYCFIEIFLGHYGKSKKMVELLSEFESNGSSLLMKHRDHYSHSVYVFALGLAVYETNTAYRREFRKFYGIDPNCGKQQAREAANLFLEFWGLTALFHDIGYPFELPFEQVVSYFEVNGHKRGEGIPYIAYHNTDVLLRLGAEAKERFFTLYGKNFCSITQVLAYDITNKLGSRYDFTEEKMLDVLDRKPKEPNKFSYYMDHAFFSACRLYSELENSIGVNSITGLHVDALSAIILHNSLYQYSIAFSRDEGGMNRRNPLRMEDHPLAFLLMLCDELQCWDRTAYGRNSRTELHPMAVDLDFSGNAIHAIYYYDEAEQDKIDEFHKAYKEWEKGGAQGDAPRLKDFSDMAEKEQRFTKGIERIVDTADIPLHIVPDTRRNNHKNKHIFLSSSNFLHLYDFAVSLHGRYMSEDTPVAELERNFEILSLEYQLSTLNRAKCFGRYLNAIDCFYTDKQVDYEMVAEFTPEQTEVFAPMEHERWVREHQAMGWVYGKDYETVPLPCGTDLSPQENKAMRRMLREQMRCHKLAMDGIVTEGDILEHYRALSEEDQDKDRKPFNSLLKLLKKFDGLRIYHL